MSEGRVSLSGAVAIGKDVACAHSLMPLQTAGLTLEADGKRLVDSLDLTLDKPALTVVMGPNGAGKSLTLRLLHGLIEPSAGTILWGGAPMSDAIRRRQAMVFQRPVLLRRSVAANMDFVLRHKDRAGRERRDALLAQVGLLDRAGQPARLLSGGQQQGLALARALAVDPDILFLDEPTASLDPASVQMIEDVVREIHSRGTKVIFVTHDIAQARRLADEVVFLHRGGLCEHTPAGQFFAQPASQAARDFLDGRIVL